MKRVLLLIRIMACILLLAGCGAKEQTNAAPLSEEEISRYNDAFISVITSEDGFEAAEISCFFTSFYEKPEDILFSEFLRYCPVGEKLESTDSEEYASFLAAEKAKNPNAEDLTSIPVPVRRYPREAVSALLKKYANITTDDLTNTDSVIYLEKYDAYYNTTSDFAPGYFQCVGGDKTGNTVRLWSEADENEVRTQLTLVIWDGSYYIQSFQQIAK